jgi:hypothetical protein
MSNNAKLQLGFLPNRRRLKWQWLAAIYGRFDGGSLPGRYGVFGPQHLD